MLLFDVVADPIVLDVVATNWILLVLPVGPEVAASVFFVLHGSPVEPYAIAGARK